MFWFLLLAMVVVVAAVTLTVVGGGDGGEGDGPLPEAAPDHLVDPLPQTRPVGRADIEALRLPLAPRGYRMADVDDVLGRVGAELAERDSRIAELEAALAGAQAAPLGGPHLFTKPADSTPGTAADQSPEPGFTPGTAADQAPEPDSTPGTATDQAPEPDAPPGARPAAPPAVRPAVPGAHPTVPEEPQQ